MRNVKKLHFFLSMADQIVRVLGFDWIYCLLSPGVHSGTVFLALRILLALLAHPQLLAKFREGTANGGWLADADSVVRNRAAVSSRLAGSVVLKPTKLLYLGSAWVLRFCSRWRCRQQDRH